MLILLIVLTSKDQNYPRTLICCDVKQMINSDMGSIPSLGSVLHVANRLAVKTVSGNKKKVIKFIYSIK